MYGGPGGHPGLNDKDALPVQAGRVRSLDCRSACNGFEGPVRPDVQVVTVDETRSPQVTGRDAARKVQAPRHVVPDLEDVQGVVTRVIRSEDGSREREKEEKGPEQSG